MCVNIYLKEEDTDPIKVLNNNVSFEEIHKMCGENPSPEEIMNYVIQKGENLFNCDKVQHDLEMLTKMPNLPELSI